MNPTDNSARPAETGRKRGRKSLAVRLAASAALLALGLVPAGATAAPGAGLPGSTFEIDADANLVENGYDDWVTFPHTGANPPEIRKADTTSGPSDESFGQGAKEDTAIPTVVDGSIPPNKSDLKFFGLYQEGTTSDGYLNLFWSRVQDPSGTTNMDFELNQSTEKTSNGVTPKRRTGDLLIQYDLPNGGTKAAISIRTWSGTNCGTAQAAGACKWGAALPLDATTAAATINTSTISAANSDGLGSQDPRTFGEAQLKLSALFGTGNGCRSFGSAYLKSRASDAFNSALKDFIPPTDINVSNCGSVTINKTDDTGATLNGAEFTLYDDKGTIGGSRTSEDTITNPVLKCTTAGAGTCTIPNVPQGEYWVVETDTPPGHDTVGDEHVTVVANQTVTLNLTDVRQKGAIRVEKVRKHKEAGDGNTPHSGVTFTVSQNGTDVASGETDANGFVCFDNLPFGSYTVTETVPAGYTANPSSRTVTVNNAATCTESPFTGEAVDKFINVPLTDLTITATPQVQGATVSTITCTDQTAESTTPTSATFEDLEPGTYNCQIFVDP